jgi:hypothetical protein
MVVFLETANVTQKTPAKASFFYSADAHKKEQYSNIA